MEGLVSRLDGFLDFPNDPVELLPHGSQECRQEMKW